MFEQMLSEAKALLLFFGTPILVCYVLCYIFHPRCIVCRRLTKFPSQQYCGDYDCDSHERGG